MGKRVCPLCNARSAACATVTSSSTATIYGLGTITSRTTVSPNSKIECIKLFLFLLDNSFFLAHVYQHPHLFLGHKRPARARFLPPTSITIGLAINPASETRGCTTRLMMFMGRKERQGGALRVADGERFGHGYAEHQHQHSRDHYSQHMPPPLDKMLRYKQRKRAE